MTTTNRWLPLAEYSMKHQVSISTLRRRIKTEDIKFRFDDGKYFILDEAPKKTAIAEEHRPSQSREVSNALATATKEPKEIELKSISQNHTGEVGESVISAANRLLADLKKAYTQVLHEKEEQIMYLREEIVDLKTLIKVLEFENTRLRGTLPE